MLDEFVRRFGFASEQEFHHLVATTDTSTPEKHACFLNWKDEDGTKDGLLKLRKEVGLTGPPKFAIADRIDEILTKQFGVVIRKVKVDGAEFSVTFKDDRARVVCVWGELPEGYAVNGQTTWWIRLWEDSEPLPDELKAVIEAAA